MSDGAKVVSLAPYIAAKKHATCSHSEVEVDDELASLSCALCGGELDVWEYVRGLARDANQRVAWEAQFKAHIASVEADGERRIALLNEQIQERSRECNRLSAVRDRLRNEEVSGLRVGNQLRRRRKAGAK